MILAQYRMRPVLDQRNVKNRALRQQGVEDGMLQVSFVEFDQCTAPLNFRTIY